jgi:DNA helicase-2/ATP-dependent DNA helicase PcrA
MADFLTDLNDVQQAAVKDYKGPSLVIAGAGSGKTRVLTYRVAYLLHEGIKPGQILALTFTNKAAREMKERIGQLVGERLSKDLWMGTFHSIFARILRFEGQHLGYSSNYTIYDTTDSKNVIKSIVREFKLDDQVYKPGEVWGTISMAKNNLITPSAYTQSIQFIEKDRQARKPRISDIYTRYAQICRKSDAMDFDDLLLNIFILFRDFPDVLHRYQKQFAYILVDEYQDTNYVQYRIINQLGELHRNICVVGDDAQSIYSFRGARIENILNFRSDYAGCHLYKLEQNYRSTKNIVDAANSVIKNNQNQISKQVWSGNEPGEKIRLINARTDNDEGFTVASFIRETVYREQLHYKEFAILYRTNAQSRIFEESLRKLNIPYVVYGSLSFYQRKEIKDLLAYFRLAVNPYDEEALFRIINYPARGIGDTTLNKILEISRLNDKHPWDVLNGLREYRNNFNQGTTKRLESFAGLISEFNKELHVMEAFDLAFIIAEKSGILSELHTDKTPENISKYENIQELLNSIKEYTDSQPGEGSSGLASYLQNVVLLTDADTDKDPGKDRVTVMTVHASKGLEFRHVFVAGLEEELFPARLSTTTREELEEERRLFYVAITRTMKKLTLSFASTRYRWGMLINCTPSRFLQEIDSTYFETDRQFSDVDTEPSIYGASRKPATKMRAWRNPETGKGDRPAGRKFRKLSQSFPESPPASPGRFDADTPESIQAGMNVMHERFGKGKVLKTEGEHTSRKATVFFKDFGQKQLLLRFARLKIIPPLKQDHEE